MPGGLCSAGRRRRLAAAALLLLASLLASRVCAADPLRAGTPPVITPPAATPPATPDDKAKPADSKAAPADAKAKAAEEVLADRVLALPSMLETGSDLQMRGRLGRLDLVIPLEAGATVRQATLKLAYRSAPVLLSERSRLVVALNGSALAELPLSPRPGETRAEIALPAKSLAPGRNFLSLTAWQEHRDGCRLDLLRDLWTRIDPTNSWLALRVLRPNRPLRLSDLGGPAFPIGRTGGVSLLTPRPVDTDRALWLGGLVAQGLALRLGQRPLIVDHQVIKTANPEAHAAPAGAAAARIALPPGDDVLIGTSDQLQPVLGPEITGAIKGPYIGVHRLPDRTDTAVLVISGRRPDDVVFAATAFANPAFALPDRPGTIVDEAPALTPPPPHYTRPGQVQRLGEWSTPAAAPGGGIEQRTSFVLMLPPDFYVADNRKAELRINYGYKPGVGPASALHVIVNGEYAGLINIEGHPDGGIVNGQFVRLPLRLFQPGRNVVAFEPALADADAVACSQIQDNGPSVGVFGDSSLWLPMVSEVVNQPDLGLFASLAYPYGGAGDGIDVALVATSTDEATVAATWTLVARLAQAAQMPLLSLEVGFSAPDQGAHALYIGPVNAIDQRILARTPLRKIHLRPSEDTRPAVLAEAAPAGGAGGTNDGVPGDGIAPAFATGWSEISDRAAWERQIGRQVQPAGPFGRLAVTLDRAIEGASSAAARLLPGAWQPAGAEAEPAFFGDPTKRFDGVAVAIASPFAARRTVTVITAADAPALRQAVAALIQPAIWYELKGDVSAWTDDRPGVASARVQARFPLGDPPPGLRQWALYWDSYLAEHPGFWIVLVVGCIALLTALTRLGMQRLERTPK
jgi:hypothetical protein